jgi:NAD(P)-dependent dehydrogenase (short-subunit alcohol dehydrogenase family)
VPHLELKGALMSGLNTSAKTIVVTGASAGMGRETAVRFSDEGWNVIGLDLRPSTSEAGNVLHAQVDVTDRAAVESALSDLAPRIGGSIHAVANVAGIYPTSTLDTFDETLYRRIFDVNVLGVLNVTAAASPYLADGSAVVNFASIDGLAVSKGQLLYCASKAAVIMLTRSLAFELAPRRIRVNAIAPGWIDTEEARQLGRMQKAIAHIPLGRAGQPSEIAEWVWILGGSDSSSYVTGTTLNISGGEVV